MVCIMFTVVTFTVKAEDARAYTITGSLIADTPLDIINNSGSTVTFDITLDNAKIIADVWCTAVRIDGNSPIVLNIKNIGNSVIKGYNHAALASDTTADVAINITNSDGSQLTLDRAYVANENDAIVFSNGEYRGGNVTVSVDGKELNCKGEVGTHEYLPYWDSTTEMTLGVFLNNKYDIRFSLRCPDCRVTKVRTSNFTIEHSAADCITGGKGQYIANVNGVDYYSEEIELIAGHDNTHVIRKDATCTEDGNLEYWTCSGCDKLFADGNSTKEITKEDVRIAAKGHNYKDGKCAVCGADDPDYVKQITTPQNGSDSNVPKTGDSNNMAMWIAVMVVGGAAIIATSYYGRKRKIEK